MSNSAANGRARGWGLARVGVRLVTAWLAFVVVLLVVGYFSVGSAGTGPAKGLDAPVARFLARHRPGLLVPLAEQAWLILVPFAAVLGIRWWRERDRVAAASSGVVLAGAVVGTAALAQIASLVAARPRPPREVAAIAQHGFSFPSAWMAVGTAACVVMTSLSLPPGSHPEARRARRRRWAACAAACAALGASRLVLGVDWSTDVLVGAAVGVGWAATSLRLRGATWTRLAASPAPQMTERTRRRARRAFAAASLLCIAAAVPLGRSYVQALTFPGSASWQVRSVDWLRAEGGGSVVNWVEDYWYSRTPPLSTDHAPRLHYTFGTWPGRAPAVPVRFGGPPAIRSPFRGRMPYETTWFPGPRRVRGRPALYVAQWRPDRAHPGLLVGAMWLDHRLLEPKLVPGTREPGGRGWAWGSEIPRAKRRLVVAAFNAGFLPLDHPGGYETEHRIPLPLRLGGASLVIWRSGRADVVAWTPRLARDPAVVSVRQNLALVVDHGHPVARLLDRVGHRWGGLANQREYTWRSGLGIDRRGNLIYIAGNHLSIKTIALALTEAGAVRGMELDIHPGVVTANLYVPDPRRAAGVDAYKLLASMPRPATRYLKPDQRDFVAMVIRPGQSA